MTDTLIKPQEGTNPMNYRNYIAMQMRLDRMRNDNINEIRNLDTILANQCNQREHYITDKRTGIVYDRAWITDRLHSLERENLSLTEQITHLDT